MNFSLPGLSLHQGETHFSSAGSIPPWCTERVDILTSFLLGGRKAATKFFGTLGRSSWTYSHLRLSLSAILDSERTEAHMQQSRERTEAEDKLVDLSAAVEPDTERWLWTRSFDLPGRSGS